MMTDKRTQTERRAGKPDAPLFGEILIEAGWTPEGPVEGAHENWARANGLVPERREKPRRK